MTKRNKLRIKQIAILLSRLESEKHLIELAFAFKHNKHKTNWMERAFPLDVLDNNEYSDYLTKKEAIGAKQGKLVDELNTILPMAINLNIHPELKLDTNGESWAFAFNHLQRRTESLRFSLDNPRENFPPMAEKTITSVLENEETLKKWREYEDLILAQDTGLKECEISAVQV